MLWVIKATGNQLSKKDTTTPPGAVLLEYPNG